MGIYDILIFMHVMSVERHIILTFSFSDHDLLLSILLGSVPMYVLLLNGIIHSYFVFYSPRVYHKSDAGHTCWPGWYLGRVDQRRRRHGRWIQHELCFPECTQRIACFSYSRSHPKNRLWQVGSVSCRLRYGMQLVTYEQVCALVLSSLL